MNGFPATSISALGIVVVIGRILVANPPARMATGIRSGEDNFGAFVIETEPNLLEARPCHGMAEFVAISRIKHEKSAAAGTDQLAANGSVLHAELIPFVDLGITHPLRPALLVLPVL